MRRVTLAALCLLLAPMLADCGKDQSPADELTVSSKFTIISVGQTVDFTAKLSQSDPGLFTPVGIVHWSSSNPAIASVSSPGFSETAKVTGVSDGEATITATTSNRSGSQKVTVIDCIVAPPSDPSGPVASCSAPTWNLNGVVGSGAVSLSSGLWTLTGTLSFDPPPQLQQGTAYQLSATFAGTLTGLNGGITARIEDDFSAVPGAGSILSDAIKFLNAAQGSVSGSVTATSSWTIPASELGAQTLKLTGIAYGPFGDWQTRVATYTRAP